MALLIKVVVVLLLFLIIFNLGKAMTSMLKPNPKKLPMSTFIGRRLIFSVLLIIFLLVLLGFGLIQPNPRPY